MCRCQSSKSGSGGIMFETAWHRLYDIIYLLKNLENSLLSSLAPDPSSSCIFDIDAGCVNMELLICKSSLFDQFIAQTLPITFCALYIYMFITCNICAHFIPHSRLCNIKCDSIKRSISFFAVTITCLCIINNNSR